MQPKPFPKSVTQADEKESRNLLPLDFPSCPQPLSMFTPGEYNRARRARQTSSLAVNDQFRLLGLL